MKPQLPLDQMTVEDKLQTMETLWDSLSADAIDIPSPDWHGTVVEARLRKLDAGESELIPLAELRARRRR